ncbi:MAG: riboflavin synthase [Candidatus Syntrophosphaera sp.]|nr:riboflavin synthase [Candidatus Syntrophosphaera sp.]
MFTGIIQATAKVLRSVPSGGKHLVTVERPASFSDLREGASIACDGICLTVLSFDSRSFTVEVMRETLTKSTASAWNANTLLNLEPALQVGDRLDGHWVLGHIDRTAQLLASRVIGSTTYLRFELHSQDRPLVVSQGSIAINGVSLTVTELDSSSFTVALITHTLQNSNLGKLAPGNTVNLEYDILGKYILNQGNHLDLSMEGLREQGY